MGARLRDAREELRCHKALGHEIRGFRTWGVLHGASTIPNVMFPRSRHRNIVSDTSNTRQHDKEAASCTGPAEETIPNGGLPLAGSV